MPDIIIRELKRSEITLLEEFLYHTIFQSQDIKPLPKEIIETPDIWVYIDKFGKDKNDFCLVAEVRNGIIGAVWVRILDGQIKGYGNIDSQTPEFSISVLPDYRNRGIGTLLMQKMISVLIERKYKQASLSVNKNNYAVSMYNKLGFQIIKERKEDYLMLLKLINK